MHTLEKHCSACGQTKPIEEFGIKIKATGRRQAHCKPCVRANSKKHYAENKAYYLDKAAKHNEAYRGRNQELVAEALAGQHCCNCESAHDLTFYQGPDASEQPVHMAVHSALSEEHVLAAIGRSVIVCKPCLGQHFYEGIAWWRMLDAKSKEIIRARRERDGFERMPKDLYKAYRPVGRAEQSQ